MQQDSEIHKMFFMVQKKIQQILRDSETNIPLSRPEVMALKVISEQESPTVSSLSEMFNIRKSSVSILVHRLKKKGLVKFEVDEKDKRVQVIHLTDDASGVLREMHKLMANHSNEILGKLTEKDKDDLIRIMRKIVS